MGLLYVIFFLSGATGLVYEVVWVRLTGLVFGNTSHAIAVVLSAFMAGLALGSWALGRKADQVARPLRLYGLLEIGIGISAALVPVIFKLLDVVYSTLAPTVASIPAADGAMRFVTSFIVLLIPTFLMGGTLPALARFFARAVDEVERKVAVLYALNTFGAAAGTLIAALVMIPRFGNRASTLAIGAVNILIGLAAMKLDGQMLHQDELARSAGVSSAFPTHAESESETATETPALPEATPADRTLDRLVLLTLAGSGLASMIYEVAWTRALSAMIGSSTYAFSIMLITFLAGLALGSAFIGRRRPKPNARLLGWLQLGIVLGGIFFLVGYVVSPYVLVGLLRAMDYSFPAVITSQFSLSAVLMIFSTLCMGATLPVATQMISRNATALGRSIGNVYSINTLGAIAGSTIAGFVLMPLIGTERTILVGLFVNSALALALLSHESANSVKAKWFALTLLVLSTLAMSGGIFWKPEMMDRGVLIYSKQFNARPEITIEEHYQDTKVVYFKEGANATISVRQGEDYLGLRTNGKVDASNRADMMTQLIVGYLPILYHPKPDSVMVVGYGSGVTVGATAAFDEVKEIDCIEIEEAVFEAAPFFSSINKDSYKNPKVKTTFADARHIMNTTQKKYDVIISEPSNPWVAGVASLFTSDFYERAAAVLKPDGVFAQWVQLYELDPEDLRMILYEVQAKFPEVSAWITGGDLVLIATRQPQQLNLDRAAAVAKDPRVAADFRDYLLMHDPRGIGAYYVTSSGPLRRFAVTNRRNSDDHPTLEFHAPQQLFQPTIQINTALMHAEKDGLLPPGATASDMSRVYAAMIEPLLEMERDDLAEQARSRIEMASPGSPYAKIATARIGLRSGALQQARKAVETIAEEDGEFFAEARELMGQLDEREGNTAGAAVRYLEAAKAAPSRPTPIRKLAEIAAAAQNWTEAAARMKEYIATQPKNPGLHWAALGEYYFAGGKVDEALDALNTALKIDTYSYWARFRRAKLFESRNEKALAIREYEFIVRYAFDRDPDVYLKLAALYRTDGRLADARSLLKTGLRLFPANVEMYRIQREINGA